MARHLAETVDNYRPAIETILAERTGQDVSIGRLRASWQGPSLSLEATRVTLGGVAASEQRRRADPIRLGQVRIRLDGLRSLFRLGLVFDRIEADSLDVILTRNQDDRLQLAAWRDREDGDHPEIPVLPEVFEESLIPEHWKDPDFWFDQLARRVSDPEVRITRITLGVESPEQDTVYIDVPQLDLAIEDGVVAASGRAMRSGTTEQLATITIVGKHLFDGQFSGEVHANLRPGRVLDAFTRELRWQHLDIVSGEAEAETWLNFESGQLVLLNGRLRVPRLDVTSHGLELPSLEDFSAAIGWRRTAPVSSETGGGLLEDGQWHFRDLQWRWRDQAVEGFDLKLERLALGSGSADSSAAGYQVTAGRVPLTELTALAQELDVLPGAAHRALGSYQPGGVLRWASLRVPGEGNSPFELSAVLDKVSVAAHGGAPGVSNIDGFLWLDAHGGWVEVDSRHATLGFPQLFLDEWAAQTLSGRVSWRLDPGIIRVFGRNLNIGYEEDTRLTGAFDLKLDAEGDDNLGLGIQLENGRADMLADFVPAHSVSDGLYQWLTTAITGGVIEQGLFFAHGQIGRDLPPGSFSTSMRYRFRDGEITYDPRWPEVTGAIGEVVINNGRTDIRLEQARTGGLDLEPGRVQVLDVAGAATVQVDTAAKVTGEQVAFWLANTPLGEMAGPAADNLELAGDYNVELGLGIPLDVDRDFSVSGRLETRNGEVRYPPAGLTWTNVQGELAYSSRDGSGEGNRQGLQASTISAQFLGHSVAVTLGLDSAQRQLRIQQEGRGDVRKILRNLLAENADAGVEGFLPYTATLVFAPGDDTTLNIQAESRELVSVWPEPLALNEGTAAGEIARPLIELELRWLDNNQLRLDGQWGDRAGVRMGWLGGEIFGADVQLGNVDSGQPESDTLAQGVRLKGEFSRLEPAAWQVMAEALIPGQQRAIANENELLFSTSVPWLQRMDVVADELVFGAMTFPEVSLTVTPEAGGWLISTVSERATGRLRLPAGGELAWLDLERLQLARPDEGEQPDTDTPELMLTPTQQLEAFRQLATDDWPELDVRIESLWLGEQHAGAWSFVMSPEADQVTITDIQGRLRTLALEGQLSWGVRSGEAATSLTASIEGGALSDLSALIGEDIPLTNRATVIGLELAWPGRPDQLQLERLNGELVVRLDDGVILERNNTAQLFRLFNLLNTDTLQRRLRFDFSDLYEAGVAFDAISGTAKLTDGVLAWTPELQLAGPSGAFRLTGSTSLADESLDMRLVVILPLTQNLPLAAILMGASPPIGGALFVLDKLLGEPLSRLTSATYSVTGTWSDPDVRLRNIFDTGE